VAVDPLYLEILVCPKTRGQLEVVDLPAEIQSELIERFRDQFRDEEPEVLQGLYSPDARLVYPVVSGIPVMLLEHALPAERIGL
jgi:uncharacterized protein YbaR (Trm112 family)